MAIDRRVKVTIFSEIIKLKKKLPHPEIAKRHKEHIPLKCETWNPRKWRSCSKTQMQKPRPSQKYRRQFKSHDKNIKGPSTVEGFPCCNNYAYQEFKAKTIWRNCIYLHPKAMLCSPKPCTFLNTYISLSPLTVF